jgi:hypothetical protein
MSPAIEPQGPAPHVLDAEHLVHRPRVSVEDRLHRVLVGGLDGQERDVLVI